MSDEELKFFRSLEDVKVVFDVGARDNTEYLEIRPEAEYHLFEPNIEFFNKLKDKVGDKKNVHLNNFGIGDTNGNFTYFVTAQSFEGGEYQNQKGDSVVYPMKRLDDYIEEHKIEKIDFLKLDTEGWDYRIIAGNPRAIEISQNIQYEYWNDRGEFHILEDRFNMEYIGQRNVVCKRKK